MSYNEEMTRIDIAVKRVKDLWLDFLHSISIKLTKHKHRQHEQEITIQIGQNEKRIDRHQHQQH